MPVPETPKLTTDIIIETTPETVVLVKRKFPPPGWAIPGGFVDVGETVEHAAAREAKEETGLDVRNLKLFSVQSDPRRDPRSHTVAVVYTAQADGVPTGGDDAAEAVVFAKNNLPDEIAFDHREVLERYFSHLK